MAVQVQADLSSLGLAGLGAFAPLLGAMSADNVSPMALIQLENLGSLFNVNGPYASRVPAVLTRAISHPVGRLSLAVGWRRGDAISALAASAGGQAVSLLATSLMNIYGRRGCGLILSGLCSSLLPKSMPRSNPTQLADVAVMIAAKAGQLSFGNILAQQTYRVLSVYEQIDQKPSEHLLEIPTTECIIQLFESLRYLQMEKHLIRVTGSIGALYFAAIVLFMFPYYAMVTVESVVIHDNDDRRIILEISAKGANKVQVETELSPDHILVTHIQTPPQLHRPEISLQWDGWLAQALCLEFGRYGLIFTQELRDAFCQFMVGITPHLKLSSFGSTSRTMSKSRKDFTQLLGPHYQHKMAVTCQAICGYAPQQNNLSPVETWQHFSAILERVIEPVPCQCGTCDFPIRSWANSYKRCRRHNISRAVGKALSSGIMCFLLEPRGSVTLNVDLSGPPDLAGETILCILNTLGLESPSSKGTGSSASPSLFFAHILNLVGLQERPVGSRQRSVQITGSSCTGSSIYPTALESFEIDLKGTFGFTICEGMFIHDEAYYDLLGEDKEPTREPHRGTPAEDSSPVTPSTLEQPMSLTASLRGGFNEVLLRLNVHASGYYFDVSAYDSIIGLMCLDVAESCEHDVGSPLQIGYEAQVVVARLGVFPSPDQKISFIMSRGNRKAQFVACGLTNYHQGNLLLNCCLNCGVEQALKGKYQSLIAA